MAREQFIDNLRLAWRILTSPEWQSGTIYSGEPDRCEVLSAADRWLVPKAVEGFDPDDFADWPQSDQEKLAKETAAFLAIAEQIAANKEVTTTRSRQARKHLERVFAIVRGRLLHDWLQALETLTEEAVAAATAKGWFVEKDQKQIVESLLGVYEAPRVRIRTTSKEVVLDPIACFGSGRQGVVDLVTMPTYETASLVAYKDGHWQIVSMNGTVQRRPFSEKSLINAITRLPAACAPL